jgi:hypothetical protein
MLDELDVGCGEVGWEPGLIRAGGTTAGRTVFLQIEPGHDVLQRGRPRYELQFLVWRTLGTTGVVLSDRVEPPIDQVRELADDGSICHSVASMTQKLVAGVGKDPDQLFDFGRCQAAAVVFRQVPGHNLPSEVGVSREIKVWTRSKTSVRACPGPLVRSLRPEDGHRSFLSSTSC